MNKEQAEYYARIGDDSQYQAKQEADDTNIYIHVRIQDKRIQVVITEAQLEYAYYKESMVGRLVFDAIRDIMKDEPSLTEKIRWLELEIKRNQEMCYKVATLSNDSKLFDDHMETDRKLQETLSILRKKNNE